MKETQEAFRAGVFFAVEVAIIAIGRTVRAIVVVGICKMMQGLPKNYLQEESS